MANGGTAEWRKGYIPNLPDIFSVHADTNIEDNNDDDDDDDTLIFYSIELNFNRENKYWSFVSGALVVKSQKCLPKLSQVPKWIKVASRARRTHHSLFLRKATSLVCRLLKIYLLK